MFLQDSRFRTSIFWWAKLWWLLKMLFIRLLWFNNVTDLILFLTLLCGRIYSCVGRKQTFREFSYYHRTWNHQWSKQCLMYLPTCGSKLSVFKCSNIGFYSFIKVDISIYLLLKLYLIIVSLKYILSACFNFK